MTEFVIGGFLLIYDVALKKFNNFVVEADCPPFGDLKKHQMAGTNATR